MARMPVVPKSSVWPSGADLATMAAPMLPPAPERFSTTTGCLSATASRSARSRPITSVDPPGAKGTTSVTGPFG